MQTSSTKRYMTGAGALVLFTLTACAADESTSSSRQAITVAQLGDQLAGADRRLDIDFASGLVAREVEVYPDSELAHEEYIESAVVSIDPSGTMVLELGNLIVGFDAATRFRTPADSSVASDAWIGEVQGMLAAGQTAFVRASRPPAGTSGATGFTASDLRIEDKPDAAKMEVNVSADNLAIVSTNEATLTALGLEIAITPATELFVSSTADDRSPDDDVGDDNGGNGADDGPLHN